MAWADCCEKTSINVEERYGELNEQFEQELDVQKCSIEDQNKQHRESVKLQQKRYEEQIRQHEESTDLAQTALDLESTHYQDLSKQFEAVIEPKTRHDEIFDFIILLYDRIVLYRDWLAALSYDHRKVAEPYYLEAINNFHNQPKPIFQKLAHSTEKELRARNFDEAQRLVEDTYTSMSKGYQAYELVVSSNTTTNVP